MWCAYGKQPINMQPPKIGVEDVLKYIAIFKQIRYPQLELGVLLSISCSPGGAGCPGSGGFLGVLDHIGFGFPVSMFVSKRSMVVQKTLGIPRLARGFTVVYDYVPQMVIHGVSLGGSTTRKGHQKF